MFPLSNTSNTLPIYPFKEIVAYEALWAHRKTTFKSLADMFSKYPNSRPSDFIDTNKIPELVDEIKNIVLTATFTPNPLIAGTFDYPPKLKDAEEPVELLYYVGNLDYLKTQSVAIVGTREPTRGALEITKEIATKLVKDNITVVSGLAAGIDTQAHEAAISAKGRTIAVIGTPLNRVYPKQNENLQNKIAKEHLLISQVPFYRYSKDTYITNKLFFLERNKTMSALSDATIIIEAGETSGSLTQASAAVHQRRKLFIWDSCFKNPDITWPERFANKGAKRISSYEELKIELMSQ
jgi:DNA processing protein